MLFVLEDQNSIASQFMSELRDITIQSDRMRFRTNLQRIGNIMAYEISKKLSYGDKTIETPLAKMSISALKEQPVLITILRAGIPYFNGFQQFFDRADCGFIGAYRKEDSEQLKIKLDYVATPSLEGRDVILIDPMLATGFSVTEALKAMKDRGYPRHLYIACVVAANEGLDYLKKNIKIPYSVWCVSVDEKLNQQLYIVPGLGDAGDLSFGEKI
ncbi:MAG TPA: uracil phosphoribosyltransferase [Cytophagales bacterium]|nr:uracil phosphoribosyltransferase [Cytophagales bacterium]